MAVAQSAMHNWLDHPFAVSRPRPSRAGVPARCGSLRCAVHEVHGGCISGRRQVDGGCYAWDVSRHPGPSARIRLGGPCPGVLTGREPRIQGFCLRVWRSSGPAAACTCLSVGSATREPNIAESAPGVSVTRCRLRRSVAVWRCRQERSVKPSAQQVRNRWSEGQSNPFRAGMGFAPQWLIWAP